MSNRSLSQLLERFPALSRLGPARGRRRIPIVRQLAVTECGAACLAMVLNYHGRSVQLDELRSAADAGRDGVTARSLLELARAYGLRGRGVRVELEQLELLEPGTILHWEFRHFVVFERLQGQAVDIVDPAAGRRRIPLEAFGRSFTGVALLLEPGEAFQPGGKRASTASRYVRQVLAQPGLLLRVFAVSAMLQLFALAIPSLTTAVVDSVLPRGDRHLLGVLAAGMLALGAFQLVSSLVRSHLLLQLRTQLDARMTLGFVDHLVDLPLPFFQLRSAGDLMNRLNSNATVREILTSGALSGLLDGVLVFGYLALLLCLSPTMAALALGLGLLQVSVFVASRRAQHELMTRSLEVDAASSAYQVEMLTGMPTLKALGVEPQAVERWSHLYVDVLNASLARGRLSALTDALTQTLRLLAPLIILFTGALLVLDGQLSLGTMLGLSALAGAFLGPLSSLVSTAFQLQLLGGYLDRIDDVLEAAPEQGRGTPLPVHTVRGGITLDRVSFRYGRELADVVSDVSVDIQPGQFVAIVGRSGAGKTTLANLLLGMYLPTSGRVLYDGVELGTLDLRALRQQMGIVLQNPFLFRGSIRSNIALSRPSLSLEEVMEAARLAHIHDDIMAMPMGYETQLSETGGSISGGQRQRLALARALALRPSILLLDEATNALDTLSESRVQQSLAELRCTRLVIAHRLSTVRDADLILVMDQGRLAESGTHEQLLRRGGVYASLVQPQQGGIARVG